MKTKEQKQSAIKEAQDLLSKSQNIAFVDFTGISDGDMKVLRKTLKDIGAKTKIIKKRLLRVALEKSQIDLNPEQFDEQLATIFSDKDISDLASPIYKFYKEKEKRGFKMLGAYNLAEKSFMDGEMFKRIGQLPSREILLAQFVGMLQAPIRMLAYVLDQKSKQVSH